MSSAELKIIHYKLVKLHKSFIQSNLVLPIHLFGSVDCSIEMGLRQEIDGSQGEQLESAPCRQILQDEENSRIREELSPAQIREETTDSSFSRSRRPSQLHKQRNAHWGSKMQGCHSAVGDVNIPIGLFARLHLDSEVHTCWGGP